MRRAIALWNVLAHAAAVALSFCGAWLAAILALFSGHALWLIATLLPRCSWWGPQARKLPGSAPRIWITIDDGPDPRDTPALLELLSEFGARATFFVIGQKAAAHPELLRDVLRRGHEIGNHTQTHPAAWFWAFLPSRIRREIESCGRTVRELAPDARVRWFRAPAGLRNHWLHPVLASLGLRLAGWSARGFDGVRADVERVVRGILADIRPGAIVLLHEGQPFDFAGGRMAPRVLRAVLEKARSEGLRCELPE